MSIQKEFGPVVKALAEHDTKNAINCLRCNTSTEECMLKGTHKVPQECKSWRVDTPTKDSMEEFYDKEAPKRTINLPRKYGRTYKPNEKWEERFKKVYLKLFHIAPPDEIDTEYETLLDWIKKEKARDRKRDNIAFQLGLQVAKRLARKETLDRHIEEIHSISEGLSNTNKVNTKAFLDKLILEVEGKMPECKCGDGFCYEITKRVREKLKDFINIIKKAKGV